MVHIPDGCRHEICKIKDIKLNFQNLQLLNFNIHKLLLNKEREENNEEEAVIKLKFKAIRHIAFHDTDITR